MKHKYDYRLYGFYWNEGGWWTLDVREVTGRVHIISESFDKQYIVDECERLNKIVCNEF